VHNVGEKLAESEPCDDACLHYAIRCRFAALLII